MRYQALFSSPHLLALAVGLCAVATTVGASEDSSAAAGLVTPSLSSLSSEQIQEGLEQCNFVKQLNEQQAAAAASSSTSLVARLFTLLFPSSSPAVNALLATAYISGPPNFLLALCPPNIDPSSLSIMVAFAVGGLLGDTLFHLLPEIFLGEHEPDRVRFVLLEPNRNLLLGVGILSGIVTFMAMDKILRIATGGAGHSHSHGHSHEHEHEHAEKDHAHDHANGSTSAAQATPNESSSSLRQRNKSTQQNQTSSTTTTAPASQSSPANPSVKLAGLLNLIADFTHNITDGLALSSSFYASPALGATTTMAVFFHEIPHEVGDFALLIQSGFSKRKAMGAQFITAIGAFLGTLIGIFVQEVSGSSSSSSSSSHHHHHHYSSGNGNIQTGTGIWGTSLQWGDMLLPFTAGTFLYVGTVAVIPELLETPSLDQNNNNNNNGGGGKGAEIRKSLLQFVALFVGAAIMLGISWS